jgi:hypothetical protein
MPMIELDQDRRAKTQAVTKPSILTCISTSGLDVYTRGISDDHQTDLRPGESMLVKASTLVVRIFSTQPGNAKFSAKLSLDASVAARRAYVKSVTTSLELPD